MSKSSKGRASLARLFNLFHQLFKVDLRDHILNPLNRLGLQTQFLVSCVVFTEMADAIKLTECFGVSIGIPCVECATDQPTDQRNGSNGFPGK